MGYKYRTFTDEEFINAVKNNFSKAGVLKDLKLNVGGANYKMVARLAAELKCDTKHFTGQGHSKGKVGILTSNKLIPLTNILVKNSIYGSHKLKLRLIKSKQLIEECSFCKITNWNNMKLSFHLDHINGINNDNRLENLRLLCPNCHSQTSTYAGKNKKAKIKFKKLPT